MNKKTLQLLDSAGLYGAENVVLNLSAVLKETKFENHIGCFHYMGKSKPEVGKRAEETGITTVYFSMSGKLDFGCIKNIAKYCQQNNISLIHSHGYKTSGICLLLRLLYGIPYVITSHMMFPNLTRMIVYSYIEKVCMLFAEKVIGVSEEIVLNLNKGLVPKKKLLVIDNGIDTEATFNIKDYNEKQLRRELGLREDSILVGSLGRLTEQKDYGTLILSAVEVLKKTNNCEFFIAGEGLLKDALLQLVREHGVDDSFHFVGYREDIGSLLKLMDIFVLSSLSEGLPMAMLEAMAAGLPIVVTRVGGIPQVVINNQNGQLVDKDNPQQLAEALLALVKSKEKRSLTGNNARKTILAKYSMHQMTQKHIELYNSIISRRTQ